MVLLPMRMKARVIPIPKRVTMRMRRVMYVIVIPTLVRMRVVTKKITVMKMATARRTMMIVNEISLKKVSIHWIRI